MTSTRAILPLGIMVSGRGSNLQALIDAAAEPGFPARIALVISNVPGVHALERAAAAGIATRVIPHKAHPDRDSFDAAVEAALLEAGVEFICLAGFMRIFGTAFARRWHGRMVNIHPSLLPAFKGLHPHRQALDAGVRVTGCTVHYVTPDLDAGPILVQAAVPVLHGDDEARLAARVLEAEHRCYPLALRLIAEGRLRLEGERVIAVPGAPETGLLAP